MVLVGVVSDLFPSLYFATVVLSLYRRCSCCFNFVTSVLLMVAVVLVFRCVYPYCNYCCCCSYYIILLLLWLLFFYFCCCCLCLSSVDVLSGFTTLILYFIFPSFYFCYLYYSFYFFCTFVGEFPIPVANGESLQNYASRDVQGLSTRLVCSILFCIFCSIVYLPFCVYCCLHIYMFTFYTFSVCVRFYICLSLFWFLFVGMSFLQVMVCFIYCIICLYIELVVFLFYLFIIVTIIIIISESTHLTTIHLL